MKYCLLLAIALAIALPHSAEARATISSKRSGFVRPTNIDRYQYLKRRIGDRLHRRDATGLTSHELYRKRLRESKQDFIKDELDNRGITTRRERLRTRTERLKKFEEQRKSVTPRTGGIRTDVRPVVPQRLRQDVNNPCAGFSRRRLIRCNDEIRRSGRYLRRDRNVTE